MAGEKPDKVNLDDTIERHVDPQRAKIGEKALRAREEAYDIATPSDHLLKISEGLSWEIAAWKAQIAKYIEDFDAQNKAGSTPGTRLAQGVGVRLATLDPFMTRQKYFRSMLVRRTNLKFSLFGGSVADAAKRLKSVPGAGVPSRGWAAILQAVQAANEQSKRFRISANIVPLRAGNANYVALELTGSILKLGASGEAEEDEEEIIGVIRKP